MDEREQDGEVFGTTTIYKGFSADDYQEGITNKETPEQGESEETQTEEGDSHAEDQAVDSQGDAPERSPKKTRKNPFEKRIAQMHAQNAQREQELLYWQQKESENEARLAQQAVQIQELSQALKNQNQYTTSVVESKFDADEARLIQDLKDAKEMGDADRDVRLTAELANINAKRENHRLVKDLQAQQLAYQEQNEPYVPIERSLPPQFAPVDYEFEDWKQANPWYERNPRLRTEADQIADELANHLTFNNQAELVGTPEFRNSVVRIMKQKYGSNEQPREEQPTPAYREGPMGGPPVSPVSRQPSHAQQYMNQNRVTGAPLTSEEMAFARCLPRKIGETDADLYNRYRKAKAYPRKAADDGTGTPDRLVF